MRCFLRQTLGGRGGGVRHDIFFLGSGMENRGCALAQGSFYEGFSPMSKKPCAILSETDDPYCAQYGSSRG